MVDIISLNQLSATDQKTFVVGDSSVDSFAYSDGAETERYLHQVLNAATDLSTRSDELQAAIVDWPSEYHLSGDRSNLLRPFNLDSVSRVLELGSGCGAISRYLGELGKQVDAVEGSAVRAELGAMRCRDLDNVRVINANYNDLEFPEDYYDLILFVGVIEYASKFHPDTESDGAAAKTILGQSRKRLNQTGAILVAIENRLGLKYMLGAHEDHYAKRYIGINGYRESAGIATYSQAEWRQLIEEVGFDNVAFSYPFPDYKIPRVVLAEDYVYQNPHAANHLEGIISRDYFAPTPRTPTEMICWQAASAGNFLGKVSNSFCMLMAEDPATVHRVQDFDFCHGPGQSRKNSYAVTTTKPAAKDKVLKYPLVIDSAIPDSGIRQQLEEQPFIRGDLLAAQWLRTILIYVRRNEFDQMLNEYYQYLGREEKEGSLHIDLLPINIIIDEHGAWQPFDREWQIDWTLTKEFLLFRALLTFIVSNWIYLKDFLGWLELQTVRDFVEYGFHINSMQLNEHLDEFTQQENRFQKAIARASDSSDVNQLLATVFEFNDGTESVHPSVLWRARNEEFTEQKKTTVEVTPDPEINALRFSLDGATIIESIRFDPFDIRKPSGVGFFQINAIRLVQVIQGREQILWQLEGAEEIANHCVSTSAEFSVEGKFATWVAITDFPKLEFDLSEPHVLDTQDAYFVDIEIAIVKSMEYALAYSRFLVKERQAILDLQSTKAVNEEQKFRLERLEHRIADMGRELEHIKSSKPFLIGSQISKFVNGFRKLGGKG
ncbi:MAG: class I SAM-dependent methyltransferase [Arenicellales bacterium]